MHARRRCSAKIESGQVDQPGGMISEENQRDGYALLCVAYPQSDDCRIRLIPEVRVRCVVCGMCAVCVCVRCEGLGGRGWRAVGGGVEASGFGRGIRRSVGGSERCRVGWCFAWMDRPLRHCLLPRHRAVKIKCRRSWWMPSWRLRCNEVALGDLRFVSFPTLGVPHSFPSQPLAAGRRQRQQPGQALPTPLLLARLAWRRSLPRPPPPPTYTWQCPESLLFAAQKNLYMHASTAL